jgi:hypothetical protein
MQRRSYFTRLQPVTHNGYQELRLELKEVTIAL